MSENDMLRDREKVAKGRELKGRQSLSRDPEPNTVMEPEICVGSGVLVIY
jgi:hypothetical protein